MVQNSGANSFVAVVNDNVISVNQSTEHLSGMLKHFIPKLVMTSLSFFQSSPNRDKWQHLVDLADFALSLKKKLDDINAQTFNTFELRVGKDPFF